MPQRQPQTPSKQYTQMINENIAISPNTAAELAKRTGKPAQFWLSGARNKSKNNTCTNNTATAHNNQDQ